MIRRLIIVVALLFTVITVAQEGTSSPYSYYGIGINKFKGTVENQSMGGIRVFSDSIHINLKNPASYGRLRLTTYTVGASQTNTHLATTDASERNRNTSLDYLAIGIPTGRLNFGLGVIPYTSVGYNFTNTTPQTSNQFAGSGGMNKVFLTTAYTLSRTLSLGVDVNYNFGNIQNTFTAFEREIQYGTREISRTDLMGFNVNFGLDYQAKLKNGLKLHTAATYSPQMDINTEQYLNFSTVTIAQDRVVTTDNREMPMREAPLTLPAEYTLGAGLGRINKWFIGAEYTNLQAATYNLNTGPANLNAAYRDASQYRLGGYFVPEYNSLTSYLSRIVYRAGVRFEETGLHLNNEGINEFGISFGVGLPAGINFSNANIGFEYGQRGTTNSGLIKENFFKLSISLSLNDKWFEQTRFN